MILLYYVWHHTPNARPTGRALAPHLISCLSRPRAWHPGRHRHYDRRSHARPRPTHRQHLETPLR